MELATQFHAEIGRRSSFYSMQSQIDTNRVVFYFVPPRFRLIPRRYDYLSYQMSTTSRNIKKSLLSKGKAYLSLTNVPRYPESFVVSISNSATTLNDLNYVLNEIEAAGREVARSNSERNSESAGNLQMQREMFTYNGVNYASPPPPQDPYPSYVNSPIVPLHGELFQKIFKQFDVKGLYYQDKRKDPPLTFLTPDALKQELDMSLSDQPTLANDDEVITALSKMIKFSIHQAHPFYIYQLLSGGQDPYSIMADFVASVMTSNCLTYEDAPLYTLMEDEVVRASRRRLGFPEDGDGMVMPGGSIGVISAMVIARLALFPDTKIRGLEEWRDMRLTVYVNRNAHYCFRKGALLQGFGLDNVIEVEPDQDGRMNLNELRKAIAKTNAEGGTPFLVGATAGTTILGVFDNIEEISKICKENNMWLHSDASVGGSVMFSDTQLKAKLSNQQLADSFNFNPHKWLGTSIECSILMFSQNGIVKQTLGSSPQVVSRKKNRLFAWFGKERTPQPDQTRDYDSTRAFGDLAAHGGIGWERRANILKFWFTWKAKGVEGMGKHIDYTMENKDWLVNELKRPERKEMFRLVKPDYDCAGVCFYYLPLTLRSMNENSEEYQQALSKVPLPLQARLVRAGVTIPPVFTDDGSPLFTKFTILSSGVNKDDMRYLLDAMDYYGKDLPVD